MAAENAGHRVALTLLACGAPPVAAADYPTRPVTLVVALHAWRGERRACAHPLRKLEQTLGQPLVIDNRPGAGGKRRGRGGRPRDADGYTLFKRQQRHPATNAALYKKINFNPETDFAPIGLLGSQANILVVNPALPAKSMAS